METAVPGRLEPRPWVTELVHEIGPELKDVLFSEVEDGADFVIVYAPGAFDPAIDRFVDAILRAPVPFEFRVFEEGSHRLTEYVNENPDFTSVLTVTRAD